MSELPKATMFYHVSRRIPHNIISSTVEDHRGLRRSLAHGFSDKAMREQEPIIGRYVDLLLLRLHGLCGAAAGGTAAVVDLKNYYNWTTFDAIGDLVFGESFGCLEANKQHPWVDAILSVVHQGAFLIGLIYLGFGELVELVMLLALATSVKTLSAYTDARLASRLAAQPGRADLFEGVLRKRDELGLTFAHLAGNASLLVVAGSETTATLLSGATYLLVSNRRVLDRVAKEVRETFASADDINLSSVGGLSYMLAVLNESFRCYPPVTSNLVRRVPPGGQTIAGHYVPVGVSIFDLVLCRTWTRFADGLCRRWSRCSSGLRTTRPTTGPTPGRSGRSGSSTARRRPRPRVTSSRRSSRSALVRGTALAGSESYRGHSFFYSLLFFF